MGNNTSEQFGATLKEIRKGRGLSQEELAEKSNLDRTYISMLERGIKNPTLETIHRISQSLQVSIEALIARPSPSKKATSSKEFQLFGTRVSCGNPVGNDHYIEKELSLEKLLVKNPGTTFFVRSSGESMNPTIMDNDYLVVDKSQVPRNGQIILAQINNEFTVKRFHKEQKQIFLRCDNPAFRDILLTKDDQFIICGVVTSVLRSNP